MYPFFKEIFIERITNVPWKQKLSEPKHYLREMARELNIPEEIVTRKKGSFGPISSQWYKYLIPLVHLERKLFNNREIKKFVQFEENRYVLWNLVNYIIWRKIYIKRKSLEEIKKKLKKLIKNENRKH